MPPPITAVRRVTAMAAAALIASGTVVLAVRRLRSAGKKRAKSSRAADAQELMGLWTGAHEVMLIRGGVELDRVSPVFFAPASSAAADARLPLPCAAFDGRRIFALTAFDPPGISRPLAENARRNGLLGARIREPATWRAAAAPPCAVWPSYGFSLAEGWREDGFCLVFDGFVGGGDDARLAAARDAVLRLADAFEQGAIFEYEPHRPAAGGGGGGGGDALLRTTIPCRRFRGGDEGDGESAAQDAVVEAETVVVRRVPPPGGLGAGDGRGGSLSSSSSSSSRALTRAQEELLSRDWAGPAALFYPEQYVLRSARSQPSGE